MQNKKQADGLLRSSSLISIRTQKMALPYISGTVCAATITTVDSLVAGVNIGSEALAALAAAAPFLAIDQILHCLLGFGLDKLMIRAIGKEKRKEANRIFAAVLIAVFIVYLAVMVPILIFERPILRLLLKDISLVELVVRYSRPILAASPIFEVFLCIERAFRVDGRAQLMSLRGIAANSMNILFDFLLVTACHFGISGLAWASVISTALGYTVPLSHFFSKKRTVSPDFSVIFSPGELFSYLKKDIRLGSTATLDEVLEGLVVSVQTGVVSRVGGTSGLAVWSVYKTIRGVVLSIGNGASASVASYTGLMYGEKDYDGSRYAVRAGTNLVVAISLLADALVLIFAGSITALFQVETSLHPLCAQCLRIGCAAFIPISVLTIFNTYLPAVNQIKRAILIVINQKVLIFIGAVIGLLFGIRGVVACYAITECVSATIFTALLLRDHAWFLPKRNPQSICDYSITLQPDNIAAVSREVGEKLRNGALPEGLDQKTALLIEESLNYIVKQNPADEIRADIKINRHEDGVRFTIVDDGSAYNPISAFDKTDTLQTDTLEETIILGLSSKVEYNRALDLNQLSVLIRLPVS